MLSVNIIGTKQASVGKKTQKETPVPRRAEKGEKSSNLIQFEDTSSMPVIDFNLLMLHN